MLLILLLKRRRGGDRIISSMNLLIKRAPGGKWEAKDKQETRGA